MIEEVWLKVSDLYDPERWKDQCFTQHYQDRKIMRQHVEEAIESHMKGQIQYEDRRST